MGRAAQRANDVMKALTVVSAVFLPAIVLAGIMGMNFQIAFFDTAPNFYLVVGAMILFGVLFLVFARLRSWILRGGVRAVPRPHPPRGCKP